jgi:LPXTG-motif cell wall-anchored protein
MPISESAIPVVFIGIAVLSLLGLFFSREKKPNERK